MAPRRKRAERATQTKRTTSTAKPKSKGKRKRTYRPPRPWTDTERLAIEETVGPEGRAFIGLLCRIANIPDDEWPCVRSWRACMTGLAVGLGAGVLRGFSVARSREEAAAAFGGNPEVIADWTREWRRNRPAEKVAEKLAALEAVKTALRPRDRS